MMADHNAPGKGHQPQQSELNDHIRITVPQKTATKGTVDEKAVPALNKPAISHSEASYSAIGTTAMSDHSAPGKSHQPEQPDLDGRNHTNVTEPKTTEGTVDDKAQPAPNQPAQSRSEDPHGNDATTRLSNIVAKFSEMRADLDEIKDKYPGDRRIAILTSDYLLCAIEIIPSQSQLSPGHLERLYAIGRAVSEVFVDDGSYAGRSLLDDQRDWFTMVFDLINEYDWDNKGMALAFEYIHLKAKVTQLREEQEQEQEQNQK
ncbi:hypothetical protein IWZ00DRAFT_576221 [Phyllosticta capitalensis]